jgi:hypothetical protein
MEQTRREKAELLAKQKEGFDPKAVQVREGGKRGEE